MELFFEFIKYAILGIVQGVTEPLPISSSGHLVIFQNLLGMNLQGLNFEVFANFASLIAVVIIFWTDIKRLFYNAIRFLVKGDRSTDARNDFKFVLYLIIGTIPVAVIGILLKDQIEAYFKSLLTIGITLMVTGLGLWIIRHLRGGKGDHDVNSVEALLVGMAQAIALIPGISRSGATLIACLGLGMNRETALRFSFLLYIPVSIGGLILSATDLVKDPQLNTLIFPYIVGFVFSLITSLFSLKWFMGIVEKGNLVYFSIYCFIIGIAVITGSMM
ncbi:undecaprenyl-diphosphate phosphatase [Neobacillus sp. DY30]|uniref:undecaprenyl-diphosphate phosphatase n=1 Tax=Neobacillus sp. DY30 TaxID=3047871 RepID=UPI0024C0C85D|nr:undecaprenyl-diphosphate phosphatase [Neobacillus sp. DY30]WHY01373.1 undecaprenyl-diphosphate phosphatase [Neobacillus sp. DY30]